MSFVFLFVAAAGCDSAARPLASASLAGDSTCISCHAEQSTHRLTAHGRSSAEATRENVLGSFSGQEATLATANPYLHYRMEQAPGGLQQTAVMTAPGDSSARSERFDIVVGSGRKGQSYLYWREDRLYQLPVSWWRGVGWVNSPGFPDGVANFDRAVFPRCLECHATFAPPSGGEVASNRYQREEVALGISCESCHGAGAEHAERMTSWWGRLTGAAIVDPGELPRERQVEGCALCHGGIGEPIRPSFTYRPGESLEAFLRLPVPLPDEPVDVHGNQVALLMRSPCFAASQMTCATCHDVHRPQPDLGEFSATCRSCHAPGEELPQDHGAAAPGNCIDCHMPLQPTRVIFTRTSGETIRPSVRTHRIGVYPAPSSPSGDPFVTPN